MGDSGSRAFILKESGQQAPSIRRSLLEDTFNCGQHSRRVITVALSTPATGYTKALESESRWYSSESFSRWRYKPRHDSYERIFNSHAFDAMHADFTCDTALELC